MAIYSEKHAKRLIPESICIDHTSYVAPTGLKVRAVLSGETKPRVLHICSLLADGGREEIEKLVATLRAKDKTRTEPGVKLTDQRSTEPEGELKWNR